MAFSHQGDNIKTAIYIDGYNLYYGRLRATPYKWLDVVTLFRDQIVRRQDPGADVTALKYFTAPVKANYARHGLDSVNAQNDYLRALKARYGALVQIIQGFHILSQAKLPAAMTGLPPDRETFPLFGSSRKSRPTSTSRCSSIATRCGANASSWSCARTTAT